MDLLIGNISCKWNHTRYSLLYLAPFTWYNVFKIHPCCNMNQHMIRFYCWITFHCYTTHHLIDIWMVSTSDLFVTKAIINIHVHFLYKHMFLFCLGIYLGVELLSHEVSIIFKFIRNCQTVIWGPWTLTFPWAMCVFHLLPIIAIGNSRLFNYSHSTQLWWYYHLHFLND